MPHAARCARRRPTGRRGPASPSGNPGAHPEPRGRRRGSRRPRHGWRAARPRTWIRSNGGPRLRACAPSRRRERRSNGSSPQPCWKSMAITFARQRAGFAESSGSCPLAGCRASAMLPGPPGGTGRASGLADLKRVVPGLPHQQPGQHGLAAEVEGPAGQARAQEQHERARKQADAGQGVLRSLRCQSQGHGRTPALSSARPSRLPVENIEALLGAGGAPRRLRPRWFEARREPTWVGRQTCGPEAVVESGNLQARASRDGRAPGERQRVSRPTQRGRRGYQPSS